MSKNKTNELELMKLIEQLGLPPILLELFHENITDDIFKEELSYEYSKPTSILELSAAEQQEYNTARYKPLLEVSPGMIVANDTVKKGFIRYNIEVGIDDPTVLTWDGVMLQDIQFWFESEIENETILYLAQLFNLKYAEEILNSLYEAMENNELNTFDQATAWQEKILKQYKMKI